MTVHHGADLVHPNRLLPEHVHGHGHVGVVADHHRVSLEYNFPILRAHHCYVAHIRYVGGLGHLPASAVRFTPEADE